jgi:ribosomal protein S18 acetylase RimI-like enzyme
VELRWLGADDEPLVLAARDLFDHEPTGEWARRFLRSPDHHICVAYEMGRPVGFVTGVAVVHPDKGTEMFLYELGVDEGHRGRGLGRDLVEALTERARAIGCYGMWVLTEADNAAALATYTAAGATDRDDEVMLGWRFDPTHATFAERDARPESTPSPAAHDLPAPAPRPDPLPHAGEGFSVVRVASTVGSFSLIGLTCIFLAFVPRVGPVLAATYGIAMIRLGTSQGSVRTFLVAVAAAATFVGVALLWSVISWLADAWSYDPGQ